MPLSFRAMSTHTRVSPVIKWKFTNCNCECLSSKICCLEVDSSSETFSVALWPPHSTYYGRFCWHTFSPLATQRGRCVKGGKTAQTYSREGNTRANKVWPEKAMGTKHKIKKKRKAQHIFYATFREHFLWQLNQYQNITTGMHTLINEGSYSPLLKDAHTNKSKIRVTWDTGANKLILIG